jgi:hypothetical protein
MLHLCNCDKCPEGARDKSLNDFPYGLFTSEGTRIGDIRYCSIGNALEDFEYRLSAGCSSREVYVMDFRYPDGGLLVATAKFAR